MDQHMYILNGCQLQRVLGRRTQVTKDTEPWSQIDPVQGPIPRHKITAQRGKISLLGGQIMPLPYETDVQIQA